MKSGTRRRGQKKGGAYGGPVQYGKPVRMMFPEEGMYVGYLKDDGKKRHGKGVLKYKNGDEYQGEWVDDERKGKGTMIYNNGDQYQGQWENNMRNGKGVILYKNNDQYEGEWENDMRHGEGQIYYRVGTYKGHWYQDKKQGKGSMRYPDNSTYIGDWVDDKRHGEGVLFDVNRHEVHRGLWKDDAMHLEKSVSVATPSSLLNETIMLDELPSKVFDIENDNYSLHLSQIDGNQKDTPIVFLAGKDLYVFTANLIQKVLKDNTSILYECSRNDQSGYYETNKTVSYFNLRRLFTMDGLVPVKLLQKTLIASKKTGVRQRYHSVTNKINSIANDKTLPFSAKKQNIKKLLQDNKLPPNIYKFVPTKNKVSRLTSKAVEAGEPESAIGGFHCQDQGGMEWTVYSIVQQVTKHRKKTPKTLKKYSNSAPSKRSATRRSATRRSATRRRSAKSAP